MSRTIRKAYTRSKRFDKTCRSHGGCPYCLGDKYHRHNKQLTLKEALKENGL